MTMQYNQENLFGMRISIGTVQYIKAKNINQMLIE